jgi:hypothetical protein
MVDCMVDKLRRIVDVRIIIGWTCAPHMRNRLRDEAKLRFTQHACELERKRM